MATPTPEQVVQNAWNALATMLGSWGRTVWGGFNSAQTTIRSLRT